MPLALQKDIAPSGIKRVSSVSKLRNRVINKASCFGAAQIQQQQNWEQSGK